MKRLLLIVFNFLMAPLIGIGIAAFFYKDTANVLLSLLNKNEEQRNECYGDPNCWESIERFCEKESSVAQLICTFSERLKSISTISDDILFNQAKPEHQQGTLTMQLFDSAEEARKAVKPYKADPKVNKDIKLKIGQYFPEVTWIQPGSPWERAGFKVNDRVFRINNKSQSAHSAIANMEQLYLSRGPHSVWVKRDQRKLHLIFSF